MSERWKPEVGELYYFVSTAGDILPDKFKNDYASSHNRFVHGNCFKTEEEARAAAVKVRELLLSLHEPVTDCNQLPKLTAEVFDRPDCPEWATWAAVDQDGAGVYFESKPSVPSWCPWWDRTIKHRLIDAFEKWDASDWQNSLIELHVKKPELPEWCKVGEWCFCLDDDGGRKYFKITKIKDNFIYGEDWNIDYHFVKQARPRPYTAYEMKALVGKVIENEYYAHFINTFDKELQEVVSGSDGYSAKDLVEFNYTINGEPCGVLEHLSDEGEWVE